MQIKIFIATFTSKSLFAARHICCSTLARLSSVANLLAKYPCQWNLQCSIRVLSLLYLLPSLVASTDEGDIIVTIIITTIITRTGQGNELVY